VTEEELLKAEIESGRWEAAVSNGFSGNEPIHWKGDPVEARRQLDINIAAKAGAVGRAREEGRDLH
jgi:hypothetical protein